MTSQPLVTLSGITKRFPDGLANDGTDLQVYPGEIHALLGENGAGKTTLMKILYGIYQPDAGDIKIDGQPVAMCSPRDAIRLGIGMAFQQFSLIPSMTVAENVALALPSPGFRLRLKAISAHLHDLSQRYGLPIDPQSHIGQLSVGERQRAELLKLLYRQAGLLILDEPTAALSPRETSALLHALQAMAGSGHAILLISHKLDEVLAVAHRITVLRQGKGVMAVRRPEANRPDLVQAMYGGLSRRALSRSHPSVQRFPRTSRPLWNDVGRTWLRGGSTSSGALSKIKMASYASRPGRSRRTRCYRA